MTWIAVGFFGEIFKKERMGKLSNDELIENVRGQLENSNFNSDDIDELARRLHLLDKHLNNAHATIMHDDERADLDGRKRRGWTTYVAMHEVPVRQKGRVVTHLPGSREHTDPEQWSNVPLW